MPRELVVELVLSREPEPLINVTYCCSSLRIGQKALDPLLEAGKPLATYRDVVPYPHIADVPASLLQRFAPANNSDLVEGVVYNYWRGASCGDWNRSAIDALVESFNTAPSRSTIGIGHYMHGAAVDPTTDTPLVRVAGSSSFFFNTNWARNAEARQHIQWVERSMERQQPYVMPTYINYLSSNDAGSVAAAYGQNYDRLRDIKTAYDPANLFNQNRNILPRR